MQVVSLTGEPPNSVAVYRLPPTVTFVNWGFIPTPAWSDYVNPFGFIKPPGRIARVCDLVNESVHLDVFLDQGHLPRLIKQVCLGVLLGSDRQYPLLDCCPLQPKGTTGRHPLIGVCVP